MTRKRQPQAKQPKNHAPPDAIDRLNAMEQRLSRMENSGRVISITSSMGDPSESISTKEHREAMLDLAIAKDRAFATEYAKWEEYKSSLLKTLDELRAFKANIQEFLNASQEGE